MFHAKQNLWLFLLAVSLFLMAVLQACSSLEAPAPARPLKTIELLVDASVMPSGWTQIEKHILTKEANELSVGDSAVVIFAVDKLQLPRHTQEYIHRYRNSSVGKDVYAELVHSVGTVPTGWTYHSALANESVFACYDHEGRDPYPSCKWSARYEEYIVIVYTWLIPDYMSLSDLEKLIQAIDSRMAQQLGKP